MDLSTPKEIVGLPIRHQVERVGSRATCFPPPTDTDEDWLVLTDSPNALDSLEAVLRKSGYNQDTGDMKGYTDEVEIVFKSFRKGDINIILTFEQKFFELFMTATHIAKKFNLTRKDERIALFQAILYGNHI